MTQPRVYGVIAARMWLGTPGDSALVAHSIGVTERVTEEELDTQVRMQEEGFILALGRAIQEETGLMYAPDQIAENTEWLWGLATPGDTMLEQAKLFVDGVLRPETRVKPVEMTLSDVKRVTELWRRGAGRSLGG